MRIVHGLTTGEVLNKNLSGVLEGLTEEGIQLMR